jgi:hypothetical protein
MAASCKYMEDIPLFGNESTKAHKTKDEKLYYGDEEIVSREKTTRRALYVLTALVVACAAVFGYLSYNSYVNDVSMSQQISDLSLSVQSSFAVLSEKVEALGRRITGLEEKTTQLEQETAENKAEIQKTQNEVTTIKNTQEGMQITSTDAEQIATNWIAANIQGITIPHREWDFKDGKYYVYTFSVDNTSSAKRVEEELVSVTETDEGFLVKMMLTFKGFTFTNDKLHWEVGILVDHKGIATQKYINFAY